MYASASPLAWEPILIGLKTTISPDFGATIPLDSSYPAPLVWIAGNVTFVSGAGDWRASF